MWGNGKKTWPTGRSYDGEWRKAPLRALTHLSTCPQLLRWPKPCDSSPLYWWHVMRAIVQGL